MKALTLSLLFIVPLGLSGQNQPRSSDTSHYVRMGKPEDYRPRVPVEGEQAPTWTSFPEDTIQEGCRQFTRCRAYTILSYDSTWHNELGNEGLFVLRFKNVYLTAFCGDKPGTCWQFVEDVGKTVWLDDEMTDLLYYRTARSPQKEDEVLVVTKRSIEKPRF